MYGILIAIVGTGLILLIGELLWKKRKLKGEYARKFVHILTASFAAFWPLFVSRAGIVLISVLFIATIIAVKKLNLFKSLRSIRRATYGEVWYAIGIGVSAVLFQSNAIYAVAILHMALADGFAAIVGVSFSKRANRFKYNGSRKSIEGSLTFIAISFFLNALYWTWFSIHPVGGGSAILIVLYSLACAVALSGLEIASPKGSDNLIIPVAAGLFLWIPVIIVNTQI